MKTLSWVLWGSAAFYGILSILSFFYVTPHQPGVNWMFSTFLVDSDLEADLAALYVYPVLWVLIPLSSVFLCVLSWVAFDVNFQLRKPGILLRGFGIFLYALSFAPAILVVRELVVYSAIHLGNAFSSSMGPLTSFTDLTRSLVYPREIVRWGIVAVPIIVFVETGFFVGFLLPGDSLLFAAGLMAASGLIDLSLLVPLTILGAVAGDQVGYLVGRRCGEALVRRYRLVEVEVQRARLFFNKHGGITIVIARFIPVVRTFAPPVAGAAEMRYRRFVSFNIIGGLLWVFIVILSGYFLGRAFPRIVNSMLPLVVLAVLGSVLISLIAWLLRARDRRKMWNINDRRYHG
jgi:membrane-associated protein